MTTFESPDMNHTVGTASETGISGARHANRSLVSHALAEFAGSFLICLSIYLICSFGTSIYNVNMAFIALGIGVTYAAVTMLLSNITAGQFNPAVTIAAMLTSKTRLLDGVLYIVAQLIGAIGAGAVVRFLMPTSEQITRKVWLTPAINGFENGSVAYQTVNQVGISFGIVLAIVVEVIAAVLIVGMAMRSMDDDGQASHDYALAMGAAYGIGAAITYPVTGAALNPARATGIAVFAQGQGLNVEPLGQLWVFWVCPILGAAVVSLVMIIAQMAQDTHVRKPAQVAVAALGDVTTADSDNVSAAPIASADVHEAANNDGSEQIPFDNSAHQRDDEERDEQANAQSNTDEGVERH